MLSVLDQIRYSARLPGTRLAIALLFTSAMILAVVFIAFWWPAFRDVQSLNDSLDTKRREIATRLYVTQIAGISAKAKARLDRFERRLYGADTQSLLVQQLGKLAEEMHVEIFSESYEESDIGDRYLPLYIELAVRGEYGSLRSFLQKMRFLPVSYFIQDAVLSASPSQNEAIEMHLRLVTYRKALLHKKAGR